eukprot:CAMPEP_0203683350 /NCGR_PEP_ID=MMETSP0090-20130426/47477_1 /ASSEMBLY_ACC=CAM_ASM_001088 /TAXON_ID=426623 /ORGANISM="Chaetoceros affinis, Strain CCMP159" /LENGTH=449 /DNA_ID=CAMNT_0050552493 /DNA_START=670 /DNA_END=2019 /DNA_ORIENTATION=+
MIEYAEQEEGEGEKQSSRGSTRSGALLLHMISSSSPPSTTLAATNQTCHLKFHKADQTLLTSSGILDGKWYQKNIITKDESFSGYAYATATASGSIDVYHLQHKFQQNTKNNYKDQGDGTIGKCEEDTEGDNRMEQLERKQSSSNNKTQYLLKHIASSLFSDTGCASNYNEDNGLALSLAWDESHANNYSEEQQRTTRIVSSYSKGTLAVHEIDLSLSSTDTPPENIKIKETHRWNAHTLFGCAAEVWTVCFASNQQYSTYSNTLISGGDDCTMKLWDLRTCSDCNGSIMINRPIHSIGQEEYNAGVTAVAYHPSSEHLFCCGSYDESVRLWDMRKLSSKEPLNRIDVGGGVWRVKWHPKDKGRILVGAMHGGCCVVDIPCLSHCHNNNGSDVDGEDSDSGSYDMRITGEFVEHESMAYGADWVFLDGQYEAAASCSFYDRQAYIWSTI